MKSITKKGQGIRPLTDEEKDYLNEFYGEYINASFGEDNLMQTPEENKTKIKELQIEYEILENEIKDLDPIENMSERNEMARRMVDIKSEIVELDYKKDSYNRNNARNRCLLNKGKLTNNLEFRSWEEFDQNTINELEGHDLELINAYYAGILDDDKD